MPATERCSPCSCCRRPVTSYRRHSGGNGSQKSHSHFLSRKRLRRGEALGVEQLDQDESASSSLDGVISMEGSWRYSLEPPRALRWPTVSLPASSSRSLGTFLMRRILKRLRLSVGVEELERTEPSDTPWRPPSEYDGASFGTLT
ncbi:hypothetical protein EYF80_044162 [Liparis tanakae]|uniref:Uncharacterized protein n=1 Tax=Liparis tanakae TaxID=230148 RepID=A0A4Z2FWN5_9TELE|nr:hypothetical protein EYF80_044162 [Liparis tanakae]